MFEINGYKVSFYYNSTSSNMRATVCQIRYTPQDLLVMNGYAFCSEQDQFNKNIGRKIALKRALNQLTENKEVRKRFWDAYFAARNGKY